MFYVSYNVLNSLNVKHDFVFVTSYRQGIDGLPEYAYDYSSVP